MIFVPNEITDPRINLAIETFLLQEMQVDEPILLFYINEPSIIIGRNQNTIEEINKEYVDEHFVDVTKEDLQAKVWNDIKENVNHKMPAYKYIREIILTDTPLIKTTTQKVKRHEELKLILGNA